MRHYFPIGAGLSLDRWSRWSLLLVPAFAATLALMLIVPGQIYVARFSQDVLGFVDVADRTLKGQIANVDYDNVVGPLCSVFLAAGKWVGGNWGAMFPVATAIVIAAITPLLVYVIATRLTPITGLVFAAFILVLVAAPIMLGDMPRMMTFAMFYNRWGWAILSILFVMALPGGKPWDVPAIALGLAALFYIKMTFAVIGLAFVIGCLVLLPHMRRKAALALGAFSAILLVVELLWGGTAGYFRVLGEAADQSGAIRGGIQTIVNNASDLLILAVIAALAAYRGVKPVYFLFALGMAVSGLLLFGQSAQLGSIPTVVPAALLLMFAPASEEQGRAEPLVFAALAFSMTAVPAGALVWHTVAASSPVTDRRSQIDGVITPELNSKTPFPLERMEQAYAGQALGGGELGSLAMAGFPEAERFYFWTLHDGLSMLAKHAPRGSILTLDMVNPFNALLGRKPPKGVNVFLAYQRTIGEDLHPRADDLFRDVDVVMIPALSKNAQSGELLARLYAPYLRQHFEVVAKDRFWTVLTRIPGRGERKG